jgi:ribosomal protein S27AE
LSYENKKQSTRKVVTVSKFCPNCGTENATSAFCSSCGKSLTAQAKGGSDGLSIAALILSIFPYTTLIGLILGYVARSKNRDSKLAKAAIVIGWIFTGLGILGGIVLGILAASGALY